MPSYNLDEIRFNIDLSSFSINNILLKFLYIFTYVQNIFLKIYNVFNKFYIDFYKNHFNQQIFSIDYIDNLRDTHNVYRIYLDPIYYLKCLFKFRVNKYNKNSLVEIVNLVHSKKEGILLINYFNNQSEKIILNLDIFREKNVSVNDINSILENFIFYEVKNKIVHIEIDGQDITSKFLEFKNSYKLDNVKLEDVLYVINILDNKTYNETGFIKITDDDINEYIYEHNKYINL
tara:strand:- start:509 stop:1207 length:699 start_codon:yes stop_codon:yes gene_type:complete